MRWHILEIGPGTLEFTKKILDKKPGRLIVVEKDKILSENLNKKFVGKYCNVKRYFGLFKKFYFKNPVKVFGNLPYNVWQKPLTSFIKLDRLNKCYKNYLYISQKSDWKIIGKWLIAYGRLSIMDLENGCKKLLILM